MMIPILFNSVLLALCLLLPITIKWELNKTITVPAMLLIGLIAGLLVYPVITYWSPGWIFFLIISGTLIIGMAAGLLLWRFFRDPERACPEEERTIVAPADGRIIYIKRIDKNQIPVSEKNGQTFTLNELAQTKLLPSSGYLIGTSMTYLDVHVNRSPIAGKIKWLQHINGAFFSLKHPESVFQNERVSTVIANKDMALGMIQIASRLVRNIVPYVSIDSEVQQGQRVGKIRFGSQVDLIIPDLPELRILIKQGDQLKAGSSIVAKY